MPGSPRGSRGRLLGSFGFGTRLFKAANASARTRARALRPGDKPAAPACQRSDDVAGEPRRCCGSSAVALVAPPDARLVRQRARLLGQHDRDAVADRIGEPCLAADELLLLDVVVEPALGQR